MKIGITGSTGQLGRLVVNKLKEKVPADNIVALARTVDKGSDLGVEVRAADYDKPETLSVALKGIDTLLFISASEVGKRAVQHKHVIEAAKRAGVKWIIYTSLLHADRSSISLAEEHLATEKHLQASGISYTLLRNGWYTENYISSIQGALATGTINGSAGDGRISSAARADYADAAVTVLTSKHHEGKVYELAGDDSFTLAELAEEISRQTGKKISYNNLSPDEYAALLASFGLPEGLARTIAGWDIGISKGDLFDETHTLSKLIGRPTTTLSTVVKTTLEASK